MTETNKTETSMPPKRGPEKELGSGIKLGPSTEHGPSAEHGPETALSQTGTPNTDAAPAMPKEVGGRKGPEPTRYGDWERNGIISDF